MIHVARHFDGETVPRGDDTCNCLITGLRNNQKGVVGGKHYNLVIRDVSDADAIREPEELVNVTVSYVDDPAGGPHADALQFYGNEEYPLKPFVGHNVRVLNCRAQPLFHRAAGFHDFELHDSYFHSSTHSIQFVSILYGGIYRTHFAGPKPVLIKLWDGNRAAMIDTNRKFFVDCRFDVPPLVLDADDNIVPDGFTRFNRRCKIG